MASHVEVRVLPGEQILLLQGPMGAFFRRFTEWLEQHGADVWKINLNGGDWFFYPYGNVVDFRGPRQDWPDYLRRFLIERRIARVYLYNDCRPYHRLAIETCRQLRIPVMVFEEGYIRPDYVTLEQGGVNAFSSVPRDPHFYLRRLHSDEPARAPACASFFEMALSAALYYTFGLLFRWYYPHYEHHRSFNPFSEGAKWLLAGARKLLYRPRDRQLTRRLTQELRRRYFLVPLQTCVDSQLRIHSNYADTRDFIHEVLSSFAEHAPKDTLLVFKHHPMDRGHRHYGKFIRDSAAAKGIEERVYYGHDLHLPSCLDHARGVVLINSTVGLSALLHGVPLKVMGDAFYDIEGLTCQRPLEDFWKKPGTISPQLHRKFRNYLITTTQLNGSFYGRFPLSPPPLPADLGRQERYPLGLAADFNKATALPSEPGDEHAQASAAPSADERMPAFAEALDPAETR
ncbi:MAG: capsule biosynthesis protein [Sulfurifustis sp.]